MANKIDQHETFFLCYNYQHKTKRCVLREVYTEIRIESNREPFLAFPIEFRNITTNNKDKPCSAHKISVQIKTNDVMLLKETINAISMLFEVAQRRSIEKSLNA